MIKLITWEMDPSRTPADPGMLHFKKLFLVLGLIFILSLFLFPGASLAQDQINCPVSGRPINKNIYADYQGSRVYFCCPFCQGKFEGDPDKYVKEMKGKGVTLEKSPDSASIA